MCIVPWVLAAAVAAAFAGEITWTTDIKGALARGVAEKRPVYADFWAVWCAPCKAMEETTYRNAKIVTAMERFVPLKVDQDVQPVFCERHEIEALPTAMFLDGEGRELARLSGLLKPDELVARMNTVSEGYARYLEASGHENDPQALASVASYLLELGNAGRAVDLLRAAVKRLASEAPERREPVTLSLAEAQLAADELKPAIAGFETLAETAKDPALRGKALAGLVRAHRAKGHEAEAKQALERLRKDYPDLATTLSAAP